MNPPVSFEWEGFDWDRGNIGKNWVRHHVKDMECEQVFFNQPLIVFPDIKHSLQEERFYALGQTDSKRYLFVVFMVRQKFVRVISARDMNKKERKEYRDEETTPKV